MSVSFVIGDNHFDSISPILIPHVTTFYHHYWSLRYIERHFFPSVGVRKTNKLGIGVSQWIMLVMVQYAVEHVVC